MKKTRIQVALTLLLLLLLIIVALKSQTKVTYLLRLNDKEVALPANWTSGEWEENNAVYQRAIDDKHIPRLFVSTISYNNINYENGINKETFREFCHTVVEKDYNAITHEELDVTDNLYIYTALSTTDAGDELEVVLLATPQLQTLYEVLSISPDATTQNIRDSLIQAVTLE